MELAGEADGSGDGDDGGRVMMEMVACRGSGGGGVDIGGSGDSNWWE